MGLDIYFKRLPKKKAKQENPSFDELNRLSKNGNFLYARKLWILFNYFYHKGRIDKAKPNYLMISIEDINELIWICENILDPYKTKSFRIVEGWLYDYSNYSDWDKEDVTELYVLLKKFRRRVKETDYIWLEFSF